MAHKWVDWRHNPCGLGGWGGNASERETKLAVAHKWVH